jgi:hypothetical protein
MTFKTSYNAGLGAPVLTAVDDEAKYAIGTIIKAYDDTYGEGEFMYLKGAAGVDDGDCVHIDQYTPAVTLVDSDTDANHGGPVGWAYADIVADKYGWFQISGVVVANGIAGGAAGKCMLCATAGAVDDTAIAGCQVLGARIVTAIDTPSAGKIVVVANRPHVQGQDAVV